MSEDEKHFPKLSANKNFVYKINKNNCRSGHFTELIQT